MQVVVYGGVKTSRFMEGGGRFEAFKKTPRSGSLFVTSKNDKKTKIYVFGGSLKNS